MLKIRLLLSAILLLLSLTNCNKSNDVKIQPNVSDSIKNIRKEISTYSFNNNSILGNIIISGDSTIAEQYDGLSVEKLFKVNGNVKNIAVPGESIEQQFAHFIHLDKKVKAEATVFIVQAGLNNIEPLLKGEATVESTLEVFQMYLDKVRKDCPNAKIVVSAMLPCYQRWLTVFPNEVKKAQRYWSALNSGFRKLHNVDKFIDGHVDVLSDGNNNLDPIYEAIDPATKKGDGIHENNAARKVIIYYWMKGLREI